MSRIFGFSVRSSGRDLNAVRRRRVAAPVVVEQPAVVVADEPALDPADLKKDELANLAVAVGVDSSGTKADVLKRVSKKTK